MFKYAVVLFAIIACVAAKPGHLSVPFAYAAAPAAFAVAPPAAPIVTATSSQVIARNYNGIAAAPIVAAAPVAKVLAAPVGVARYAAAYSTPFAYSASPLAYSASPLAYSASPLAYSAYSAPLSYAAPAPVLF